MTPDLPRGPFFSIPTWAECLNWFRAWKNLFFPAIPAPRTAIIHLREQSSHHREWLFALGIRIETLQCHFDCVPVLTPEERQSWERLQQTYRMVHDQPWKLTGCIPCTIQTIAHAHDAFEDRIPRC